LHVGNRLSQLLVGGFESVNVCSHVRGLREPPGASEYAWLGATTQFHSIE
jgi:hypothetical protein